MWVIVSCQDYMYILCNYAYIIYIYIYTVILKEVECENVTRCSIKWEEAVVKCIVYLLKDGKKCIYVQYIQYMYDVCIYLFYIYIYRASANQETNCWSLSKIGHMIGRSFTDQVHVSMIHYRGLGRIVFLQNNILQLLVNIPFGWDVDIY